MMWKRRIHRARLWLQGLFAAFAIVLALGMGLVQIALPWIVSHPQRISAFLSEHLHRDVTLDRVEGRWESDGPLLVLHGVHIAAAEGGQPASTIAQAELKINFFAALHRNLAWNEFRLAGLDLELLRDVDGHWRLKGLSAGDDSGQSGKDSLLFDLGALVLRDLHVAIDDGVHPRIELSSEEVRLVNSGDEHRVVARVRCARNPSAAIDLVLDYDSDAHSGMAYAGGDALDLAQLANGFALRGVRLHHGSGRAQAWLRVAEDRISEVRVDFDLRDVVLDGAVPISLDAQRQIAPRVSFERIAFGARWQRSVSGWRADVADLSLTRQGVVLPVVALHASRERAADATLPTLSLSASDLDVSAPASVAMLSDVLPADLRAWLYAANPQGTVGQARLRYVDRGDLDVDASLDGVAWRAFGKVPGLVNLSGALRGDAQALVLHLAPRATFGFDAPRVFRLPVQLSSLSGDVAAWREAEGWRIASDALDFSAAQYQGQLRGAVQLKDDGSRPALDVAASVTQAQVVSARLFWPINVMPPAAVAWLDRGLLGGEVHDGRAVFRGDLADWPFTNLAGRFQAHAAISDASLAYLPDWPVAAQVDAQVDFVNNGLHVEAGAARSLGNSIDAARADIPDLAEAVLDLDVSGSGSGKQLLDFLKATPIGARYAAHLLGVSVGGTGKVAFHLRLPVGHADQMRLDGSIALARADLSDAQYALSLAQASGTMKFAQDGFDSGDLSVTRDGQPATFRLALGRFVDAPRHAVEARIATRAAAATVFAYAPALARYADHLSGQAQWTALFSADRDDVDASAQRIVVSSDLVGIASDLPQPLAKAADASLPFTFTLGLPMSDGSIDLQLGDLLRLRGRLAGADRAFAASAHFGGGNPPALPAAGLAIDGQVAQLDLSGWMDFATSGSGGGDDLVSRIDLAVSQLRAWGRDLGAVQFTLAPGTQALELGFKGAAVQGSLHIPMAQMHSSGITAQFERLHWPELDAQQTTAGTGENPANVPPLHIRIGDFRLGDSHFGDTTLESYPIAGGTHFEQVTTHSGNAEMRARGDWTGRPGSDVSRFTIDFSAHDLGRMLASFGYAGVIDGGATVAHVDGEWPGAPSMFALARLDGTLKVSVAQGRIPDANPGAGRLLGLINVSAIPRRLALDFGDFFKSGFSFDSIKGTFTLKAGNAFTDDLRVKGTAADILISGRAGLAAKDYDQVMDVTPHVGGTLMIGGAIVGGPVGAAAGALIQGVFKKALNDVTRVRYSVTGSWDKPRIVELSKETRTVAPQPPPGAEATPQGAPPAAPPALQDPATTPTTH